jgi:glyoxylase-like metal-dependent hydrolase (beta-lactamase superfamily II)
MSRRTYLAIATLIAATSAFSQDWSSVEVKASRVSGNVYMISGAGGNIGVSVGDDGIVIVDDQFAPLAPKIEAALKTITDRPVRFVLNTHYHPDHTNGNEHFGRTATIVAHENVRKRLASGVTVLGMTVPPAPAAALPVVTFNDTLTLHLNGEDIRAVYWPNGHTDTDSVIWFTKSNVVHMGDDFFNGMFPVVDLDHGGSVRGLIENLDRLLPTIPDGAKVIPGHGELSDKAGVRRFRDMLAGTLGVVERGVAAGKSLETLKSEKVLAQWDDWGKGFINNDAWIATLHAEATAPRTREHKH